MQYLIQLLFLPYHSLSLHFDFFPHLALQLLNNPIQHDDIAPSTFRQCNVLKELRYTHYTSRLHTLTSSFRHHSRTGQYQQQTMALPSTMKAITINGNKAKVSEISLPKIRPTYLLAKVEAIALNPTDWKHINGKRAAENGLAGCDFAGTVVEVGSGT